MGAPRTGMPDPVLMGGWMNGEGGGDGRFSGASPDNIKTYEMNDFTSISEHTNYRMLVKCKPSTFDGGTSAEESETGSDGCSCSALGTASGGGLDGGGGGGGGG